MSRSTKIGVHGTPCIWLLLGAMLACRPALGAHVESASGELRIEGGAIERLILADDSGAQKSFKRPGESIVLPAGTYRLHEVALEGGYVCREYLAPDPRRISMEPGQSAALMLGAPLRQTVRIERWGAWMIMRYELTGRGGERYVLRGNAEPPRFTIFQDNGAIISDNFRFDLDGACSYLWRPPLGTSGQLSVIPSHDLGALGPAEGKPTLYSWRWLYSLPGLPLWAALIPAMILPRAGRTPRALLILALVILVYTGWSALARLLPLGPLESETSCITILSLSVGLAVFWFLGGLLAGGTWVRALLGTMILAAGVVALGALSLELRLSERMIRFISVMGVLMFAAALGHTMSRRAYGRHRTAGRFVLSLAVWTAAASIFGMFAMIAVWCTTYGGWLGDRDYILWLTFVVAPSFGAGVFALSLLFAPVGLRIGFPRTTPRTQQAGVPRAAAGARTISGSPA